MKDCREMERVNRIVRVVHAGENRMSAGSALMLENRFRDMLLAEMRKQDACDGIRRTFFGARAADEKIRAK